MAKKTKPQTKARSRAAKAVSEIPAMAPQRHLRGDVPMDGPEEVVINDPTRTEKTVVAGPVTVEPTLAGAFKIIVEPGCGESLLQGFNKENVWRNIYVVTNRGAKVTIKPPAKPNPASEYTMVRLLTERMRAKLQIRPKE